MKATDVIKRDHEAAKELFSKYKMAEEGEREELEREIFDALTAHESMEDKHFYPALRDHGVDEAGIFSEIEAEQAKLTAEVLAMRALPGDKYERIMKAMDQVLEHAQKEESEIFPKAEEALGDDSEALGQAMEPDSAVAKSQNAE